MKFGELVRGNRFNTESGSEHIVIAYGIEIKSLGQPINAIELSTGLEKFFMDKANVHGVTKA